MKDKTIQNRYEKSEINKELLSHREKLILRLLALGKDNKQIGEDLFLSEHTVKAEVSIILKKLGAQNRTHAAYLAARYDIIK